MYLCYTPASIFLLGMYDIYSVHVLLADGLHDEPVAITFVSVPKTMDCASEPRRPPIMLYVYIVFVCVRRPGAFKYIIILVICISEESEKLEGFDFFSSSLQIYFRSFFTPSIIIN